MLEYGWHDPFLQEKNLMDKYGNPWSKYRVYPPKILPPLREVRHKCLDCCCESAEKVKLCPVKDCSLWLYRFGAYPEDHQGAKSSSNPSSVNVKIARQNPGMLWKIA